MKKKGRLLSFFLAVLMFASVLTAFPPLEIGAAAPGGSITIPKVGFIGEKLVIEGTVKSNGSPIDIVNIAIYKDSTRSVGVWCFRKEGLNASSFNLGTKAKLFEWGDEVESVNPDSTNPPFDTGAYSSVFVEVIVKAKDGTSTVKTETIQIMDVSKSELNFSATGGDKTFKITASSSWTVTDNKSWISVSPSSGSSSKTVTVSCNKNTSTDSREGTVTVKHSSTGETYTIDVYQDGKEPDPAEFFGSIEFSDTIKDGEDFIFAGEIEVENSPIHVVNIGLYSDSTMGTGITYYRKENVNSYSFDFNDEVPSFAWGDTLTTVNPNSTNPPFHTSQYEQAYFVVTVKTEDGESKEFRHWVTVEDDETVISGNVQATTNIQLGETVSFSGTVRSEGSPISIVNIGMYADATMNVGITYYRKENISSYSFNFSSVDTFEWGDILKSVRVDSGNPPFDTSKYGQVYFVVTVKTKDGESNTYPLWVNGEKKADTVISGSVQAPTKIQLGETFAFTGTVRSEGSPISIVNIGMYADTTMSEGITYYRKESINSYTFDFASVDTFKWGAILKTVNPSSSNPPFDTSKHSQAYFLITVKTADGESKAYPITVNAGNTQMRGDLNGDGMVTNKDRFLLNRFLNGMGDTGIDQSRADINCDGKIDAADAEYLTRHLDGWIGYEKLPTPQPDPDPPECNHKNCYDAYLKTVWVKNLIKNGSTHQYYKEFNRICTDCGKTVGKNKSAIIPEAHSYQSDGVCACGSIQTSGYVPWYAINATEKTVRVYDTPYSDDGSYGAIFADEEVLVIGSKAGRYLIEYTIGRTLEKKQGYVEASTLKSKSNFWIAFDFETAILPVSGREVLLIPRDGSGYFYLYNGNSLITDPAMLENLHIEFVGGGDCRVENAASTIVGKKEGGDEGGVGTLTIYYVVNGVKYYLQCPSSYIVADSQAVYSSDQKYKFSQTEKDYIMMALDMHFSKNMIKVPYELYWSAGENFLLCVENFSSILASLIAMESPTANDYAGVLADFLNEYVESIKDDTTIDDVNIGMAQAIWDFIKTVANLKDIPEKFDDIVTPIRNILSLHKIETPEQLQNLLKHVFKLLSNNEFVNWAKNTAAFKFIFSKIDSAGIAIDKITSFLSTIVNNTKFLTVATKVLKVAWGMKDAIEHIVVASIAIFGNWTAHRQVLEMMQETIHSIPGNKRDENYNMLDAAMNELMKQYDDEFLNRLNDGMKNLAANIGVVGIKIALGTTCVGLAVVALIEVSEFLASGSNGKEEITATRMRQFYLLLNQALYLEFEALYYDGDTFSSVYTNVNSIVRLHLNMAIYTNEIAQDVNEYTAADKAIYKNNVTNIKEKFDAYLN